MVLDELIPLTQSLFKEIRRAHPPPQIDKYAGSDFARLAKGEAGVILTLEKSDSSLTEPEGGGQYFKVRSEHL